MPNLFKRDQDAKTQGEAIRQLVPAMDKTGRILREKLLFLPCLCFHLASWIGEKLSASVYTLTEVRRRRR